LFSTGYHEHDLEPFGSLSDQLHNCQLFMEGPLTWSLTLWSVQEEHLKQIMYASFLTPSTLSFIIIVHQIIWTLQSNG